MFSLFTLAWIDTYLTEFFSKNQLLVLLSFSIELLLSISLIFEIISFIQFTSDLTCACIFKMIEIRNNKSQELVEETKLFLDCLFKMSAML